MAEPPKDIPILILGQMNARDVGSMPVYHNEQAPGAWPNGTRVRKTRDDPGDTHATGDQATVLGSMGPVGRMYFYFVEWDDLPGIPVGIRSDKLSRA